MYYMVQHTNLRQKALYFWPIFLTKKRENIVSLFSSLFGRQAREDYFQATNYLCKTWFPKNFLTCYSGGECKLPIKNYLIAKLFESYYGLWLVGLRGIKLGCAKQDLWGLGAESQCIVTSFPFGKMILSLGDNFFTKNAS